MNGEKNGFFSAYLQEQEAATFSPLLAMIEKNLCFMEMEWGKKKKNRVLTLTFRYIYTFPSARQALMFQDSRT